MTTKTKEKTTKKTKALMKGILDENGNWYMKNTKTKGTTAKTTAKTLNFSESVIFGSLSDQEKQLTKVIRDHILPIVAKERGVKFDGRIIVRMATNAFKARNKQPNVLAHHRSPEIGYVEADGTRWTVIELNPMWIHNKRDGTLAEHIVGSLAHEVEHFCNYCQGIKDTSPNGRHNGKFGAGVKLNPLIECFTQNDTAHLHARITEEGKKLAKKLEAGIMEHVRFGEDLPQPKVANRNRYITWTCESESCVVDKKPLKFQTRLDAGKKIYHGNRECPSCAGRLELRTDEETLADLERF